MKPALKELPPEALSLKLELQRLQAEVADWRQREATLVEREARLVTEQAGARQARLASLNLIEDAVDARNRLADVNQALRAEAAARELAQAEAVRERDLLGEVLDGLPGIFYLADAGGRLRRWNRGLERLSGYDAGQIAGMRPTEFFTDADADGLAKAGMAQAFGEGGGEIEAGFRSRDGRVTPFLITGRQVLIDGQPCQVVMGVDVSEQRRQEAANRALERQLRESQKMEAVGTLAGGIAHDFNNILAALLGQVALLQELLTPDHPAGQGIEQIRRGAQRARDLVQQILAFSRRQPPELKAQPLRPLVEEALAMLRASLPAQVSLEADLTDAPCHARVDATQFEQVILNLGTNAWHALADGRGWIRVTLDTVTLAPGEQMAGRLKLAGGRYVRVAVRDNGIGMDAATRARIFEPFFTTKPVGSGTGLGLAVAHGMVAEHGGAIAVDSQLGQGSEFTILMPAVDAPTALDEAASGLGALTPPAPACGERVLCVDDDETVGMVAAALLERAGYRVLGVVDGHAALAALRADPQAFDLVLADYNMPGMSGLELAGELRKVAPDVPVIISSGHVDARLLRGARAYSVKAVLNKERLVEDMVALVGEALTPRVGN